MSLNIIIADDHPVTRIGVRATLLASDLQHRVREASGVGHLHALLEQHACDVLVTDLCMPGDALPDGVRMLRSLRSLYPALPIVVLTVSFNMGLLRLAHAAGARCVLSKNDPLADLLPAMRCAMKQQSYLSPSLQARCQDLGHDGEWRWQRVPLSQREAQVIQHMAEGLTLSEMAQHYGRKLNTLSRQKVVAMRKLGVESDMELIELLRSGLLE